MLVNRIGSCSARGERGFSMLETLVTLFIISIWLLGSAGVQTIAMKLSKTAQFRNQAVIFAGEIGERMETNKQAAIDGLYSYPRSVSSVDCAATPCAPPALADFDLKDWAARAQAALPAATVTICIDPCGAGIAANPITYTISVSWEDRRTGQTYSTTSNNVETGSYTASKTIFKTPKPAA